MNTITLTSARPTLSNRLSSLRAWPAELLARERRLTIYGFVLLALLLPMAIGLAVDERTVRDVNVWVKPMKFSLSIAVVALTTAWFVGHLQAAYRSGRAIDRIVWMLIGAGSFELGYITLQSALGQASHFNVGDPFHGTMYTLMGIGALALTATQPMLAWQLHRHADAVRPAAYRLAVKIGLVLTFVFGAGIGMLLASLQPPSGGATVPLFGWSLTGGDLRPAHFFGIHAQQLLPLLGFVVAAKGFARAKAVVWGTTLAYALLFAGLVAWGLRGWV